MGIQHAHSNSHTDMNVLIEYVSVITAWQNYTYTQQMHNNTWDHNTSQWGRKKKKIQEFPPFVFVLSGKRKKKHPVIKTTSSPTRRWWFRPVIASIDKVSKQPISTHTITHTRTNVFSHTYYMLISSLEIWISSESATEWVSEREIGWTACESSKPDRSTKHSITSQVGNNVDIVTIGYM